MAHNIQKTFAIAEKPWVVVTTDSALHAFLAGLNGAGASDLADVEESVALWAVHVPFTGESGSAFVVSPEAYKYARALRY